MSAGRPRVALVSATEAIPLDTDLPLLAAALEREGVVPTVVAWDDVSAAWPSFDLALVRSAWDYVPRRDEFLAWARALPCPLANSADVLTWNTDKVYLRELESRGLADRTIVIVTADHGETLFEHGRWHGHGDHLFGDEGTRVPFAVIAPGKRASVVPAVTRDVDFAATVYDLTGVAPPPDLDGRSLAPLLDGRPVAPALAYAETELWMGDTPGVPSELRMPVPPVTRLLELDGAHGSEIVLRDDVRGLTTMARHRMVRDERFKLIYMPTRERAVYRLYDTQADPDETVEVGARYPAELERLKHELWKWLLADKSLVRRGDYLFPATP